MKCDRCSNWVNIMLVNRDDFDSPDEGVSRERERERERGGGGGERERNS